ncbi:MAG: flagellar export chaperone FliS [Terriglobales bacterium]|jgi:flagellar protein FliS
MDIRQSYREAAVRGASPLQLVVRLYEQLVEDLRRIAAAIQQKDVSGRSSLIKHAILVVGHLQSSLDFERGGKVARTLENFYNSLRQNLVQAQFFPSGPAVRQLMTDVLAVRRAWVEVERIEKEKALPASSLPPMPVPTADASSPVGMHHDWKG